MKKESWWTKITFITASAALTSTVAGSLTISILLNSPKPLAFFVTPDIVTTEAYTAHMLEEGLNTDHYSLLTGMLASDDIRMTAPITSRLIENEHQRMDEIINHYRQQLSKNKPFLQWACAETERFPLGPDMHDWFVRIIDSQKQIGYMILQADAKDHLKLAEYGLGEQQPFEESILQQTLSDRLQHADLQGNRSRLTSIYPYRLAPLLTVWRVEWDNGEMEWMDAQSGEYLPLSEQYAPHPSKNSLRDGALSGMLSSSITVHTKCAQSIVSSQSDEANFPAYGCELAMSSHLIPPFDPYDNIAWMASLQPFNKNKFIPQDYQSKKWIYVQHINDLANQSFSYIGIQKWSPIKNKRMSSENIQDELYVIVGSQDTKTIRWLPSADALQSGFFIPQS